MGKSVKKIVIEIMEDRNLRPYFVDYIGENLKTKFGHHLEVHRPDGSTFEEAAEVKLDILVSQLQTKVPERHVQIVLDEVCRYYVRMVHLAF